MKPKDLRDEFALAALPGCLKLCFEDEREGRTYTDAQGNRMQIPDVVATMCGEIADAMMAEREKN